MNFFTVPPDRNLARRYSLSKIDSLLSRIGSVHIVHFDIVQSNSDNKAITKEQVINELRERTITFGFDKEGLMSVWFIPPKSFREHTALLYCYNDGNPSTVVMEG